MSDLFVANGQRISCINDFLHIIINLESFGLTPLPLVVFIRDDKILLMTVNVITSDFRFLTKL